MPRREVVLYEGIRLVRPLHRHVYKAVENGLADVGVSVAMRAVLERLREAGPATVPQLARALSFRRQYAQRLVDELLGRALVEHAPNPAHRRSHLVRLTAEGEDTIARILECEAATLREVAAPLPAADVETFRRVMAYLAATFAERAPLDPERDVVEEGADPSPRR